MRAAISFPGCHRRGGVERVMLESANFLAARGHEIHAFASDWDAAALAPAVARHQVDFRAPIAALSTPAYLRASQKMISALRPPPDVIASFGAASPPQSVVWMQSVHAAWIDISRRTRGFAGRLKQRLNPFHPIILRMEGDLLRGRRYRKVIALTDQVKQDVMQHYDVPPQDVEVLPNGYSAAEFNLTRRSAKRAEMRRKLGYSDDCRVIVFVANELERKGFVPLIQAVAKIGDPSLRVLAVGRLNQREAQPEIQRQGLAHAVQFTGPTSEVADFYAASDLFALPTKYEAWGLVIVEAMACGLPALTSRSAGAAIAVQEGLNGYLLDQPADPDEIAGKLRRLLNGERADAAAIAQSVGRYEWARILLDYERILLESSAS